MKQTLHSVQFLRFVAASLVVFFHATVASATYFPGSVSDDLAYVSGLGAAGVHIFFVISGFVMVYATFSKSDYRLSPKQFFIKRLLRIYPIYFVYSAFYIFFYSYFAGSFHRTATEIIASLLLVPGYSSFIIGPGWTLSYEMYFYFCFALILNFSLLRGLVVLTLYFIASIILGLLVKPTDPVIHVLTNPLLIEFLCGSWIAYIVIAAPKLNSKLGLMLLFLGLAGFVLGLSVGYSRGPSFFVWGAPSVLLVGGFVFLERDSETTWFIERLSYLGDSSYSLYLLHILIIDIVFFTLAQFFKPSGIDSLSVALSLTLVSIAVAALAYALIERRLVPTLRRFQNAKKEPSITMVK